jgi:DNA polymerase (family 10)
MIDTQRAESRFMDNKTMARLLAETADLLEIDGGDSFRIRSYRRAADAAEQTTVDLTEAAADAARLMEIDGIGKSMAAKLQAIATTGSLDQRDELLRKFGAGVLELLKLPGMGPKTVALLWDAAKIGSIDQLSQAIEAGRLNGLPRMGAKQIEKLRKGIEDFRRSSGRFRIDVATEEAARIASYLLQFKGIDNVTPAGSLRRGRETVGDLDLLATGPACEPGNTQAAVEHVAAYPGIHNIIAKGENKVSFNLDQGLQTAQSIQVDVRLLPTASYGAALQYFTGSKAHNVVLRQRALKMGYTLNEWALARLNDGSTFAAATEEEIYAALGMDWMPPEMRENLGEIDAAAEHALPLVVALEDIRGDVHMHTTASDGRNSIREMADAALACGFEYIAITDHSKNLAMTNGLDEKRALEQIKQVRAVDRQMEGRIRVLTGIEVDILADGALDLDDEVLAQIDVVVASVHSRFDQPREEMTSRVLRAIENPYVRILGHPTGRLLLRREPFAIDLPAVFKQAAELGVAMEHNAAPERLDLNDHDLRLAKEIGCRIVMNSDSHDSRNLGKMVHGIKQLRRAWLAAKDVLNTRHAKDFLAGLRSRP